MRFESNLLLENENGINLMKIVDVEPFGRQIARRDKVLRSAAVKSD
jgi:hypothetical protein